MKVYIIIVTYNAIPWIDSCLESTGKYPVIVVDNASSDQTVAHIQANFPNVTLLPQKKNLGFGQGNNVGISYALKNGVDHVFLLNQDAYLVDDCLKVLIKKQQENPQFGILSPIHLNGKGDALDKNFGNYINYQNNPELLSDLLLKNEKDIYQIPFVNAAGWLVSKNCLETVGGFDPVFFHYGEDDNYCQRVLYHGFKIGIILNNYLLHDREGRLIKPVVMYSEEYFTQLKRWYKIKYGDIQKDTPSIQNDINYLKQKLLKQFIGLQFSNASQTKKKLKILNDIKKEISMSRKKNKKKGLHYL